MTVILRPVYPHFQAMPMPPVKLLPMPPAIMRKAPAQGYPFHQVLWPSLIQLTRMQQAHLIAHGHYPAAKRLLQAELWLHQQQQRIHPSPQSERNLGDAHLRMLALYRLQGQDSAASLHAIEALHLKHPKALPLARMLLKKLDVRRRDVEAKQKGPGFSKSLKQRYNALSAAIGTNTLRRDENSSGQDSGQP